MSQQQRQLGRLVELQRLAVERRQAELARQQQMCTRVGNTVARLETLGAQATLVGTQMPGLAQNNAAYKQAMLAWAEQQRQELARREAELARTQADLQAASLREETLQKLLNRVDERARIDENRREQKRQDEVATQSGMFNSAFGLSGWGRDE